MIEKKTLNGALSLAVKSRQKTACDRGKKRGMAALSAPRFKVRAPSIVHNVQPP